LNGPRIRASAVLALLALPVMTFDARAAATAERPRIVSLAPHLTELVYAAGGGDTLVGTVEFSDFPEAARALPRVGDAWRVDLERLLALHPDVVLTWTSGTPPDIVARLDALHLHRVDIPTFRLADVPVALRTLGELTGDARDRARRRGLVQHTDRRAARPVRACQRRSPSSSSSTISRSSPSIRATSSARSSSSAAGATFLRRCRSSHRRSASRRSVAADPQVILSTDDTIADPAAQWQSMAASDVRACQDDLSDPRGHGGALDAAARTGHA
jgi:iron complex transport system substrate-binding protein